MSPGFWLASETLGIIVEKRPIRKNYLSIRFNLKHYGLQSRPCPAGPERKNQALVAQMDRVLASEAKGRGFDSRRARHFSACVIKALTQGLKHNPLKQQPVRFLDFSFVAISLSEQEVNYTHLLI